MWRFFRRTNNLDAMDDIDLIYVYKSLYQEVPPTRKYGPFENEVVPAPLCRTHRLFMMKTYNVSECFCIIFSSYVAIYK